ncbi:MAG: acylphosphatase [Clostridia bacterium]|nr:acylphosphatase [Clostridia bacterium]
MFIAENCFFRGTCRPGAKHLYVRWMPDGSVLMEVQGERSRIRQLLIRLKSQPHIHIQKAVIKEISLQEKETGFVVS